VEALLARGVRLAARGKLLDVDAPTGTLQDGDRAALREHKAAVLALLRERRASEAVTRDWRRVSLYQLDRVLEVAVPWSDVPLILAPGCRLARELRAQDPRPGRVWCVCEVLDLLLTGVTPEDARKVGEARLLFDGRSVTVEAPPEERHR
jgi:hypothetical protein